MVGKGGSGSGGVIYRGAMTWMDTVNGLDRWGARAWAAEGGLGGVVSGHFETRAGAPCGGRALVSAVPPGDFPAATPPQTKSTAFPVGCFPAPNRETGRKGGVFPLKGGDTI